MRIKKNNNKTKMILFGIGALSIATMSIAISSCTTLQKGMFLPVANNVYKELEMAAKTIDEAGYKSTDGKKFVEKATTANEKVKTFIKLMNAKLKEKKIVNDDTTTLFLKNYNFQYTGEKEQLLKNLNNFSMEQPILYSQLYANSNNNDIPNLGIKFPTPIYDDGMQYFDDWWEIGAAAQTANTGSLLAKNWKGTADYVFYLYDSSVITPEEETELKKFIFTKNDPSFTAWTLFKENASFKKVIPIDLQYFYNGTWDLIGTQHIVKQISLILAGAKTNNLNADGTNLDQAKLAQDQAFQDVLAETKKSTFSVSKLTEANKLTAPADAQGAHFATSGFNNLAHAITLGILPDFVEYNNDKEAKRNIYYSAYLTEYMPDNPADDKMLSAGFAKKANDPKIVEEVKAKKIYTVLADRSKYSSVAGDWTFEKPIINPKKETKSGLGYLMNQGIIKKATFSERNDSSLTQFSLKDGFILYNSLTKKDIKQTEYIKSNKYLD